MIYIKRKSIVKPVIGSIVDTTNIENKTTNTYSANVIDNLIGTCGGADISTIIDLIYPIGRGFIDFTDADYSNWLGLTWERELLGVTPIGYKSGDADFGTIGKTGGEKTHTLTINEMPSHTHIQNAHSHTTTHYCGVYTTGSSSGTGTINSLKSGSNVNYSTNSITAINQNTGGGQAHNNLPPYQVVSYWKRVDSNAKINFTITRGTTDSTNYEAKKDMTWEEFINSSYNTNGVFTDSWDRVVYTTLAGSSHCLTNVKSYNTIISGYIYETDQERYSPPV